MEGLVKKIKKYRVELDKHFSVMEEMPRSREISIAVTSAQNAKLWFGKTLQYLDQPNPYPDSKNASNTKIAPTADTWEGETKKELEGIGHIQKVKQLRQELSSISDELEESEENSYLSNTLSPLAFHSVMKGWEYTCESVMWLGNELGRINRESK